MTHHWQALKARLGPLQSLDLTRFDLLQAHFELGRQVRSQVWQLLDRRLDGWTRLSLAKRLQQVRACWQGLQDRSVRLEIAGPVRLAMQDYQRCLEAWSEGTELARFSHPRLIDKPTPVEMALLLQHDNTGCQTGMYRLASGGVQLWHAEEDVDRRNGSRFDSLRIASFTLGSGDHATRMYSFIYPDLLPGAAFGWREDGYVQAVDTLLLVHPPPVADGMLANIVCWLALRLGCSANTQDMLELFSPFLDGYAMNLAWPEGQMVNAVRYEFAGNYIKKSTLPEEPGKYLFQVNYFSDRSDVLTQEMESLSARSRRAMDQRVERTLQALQKMPAQPGRSALQTSDFFRLLTSRAGRKWAYANEDVKAYFLCRIHPHELAIWLGSGPAAREDAPQKIIHEI